MTGPETAQTDDDRTDHERTDAYPWQMIDADAQLHLVGDVNLQRREHPERAFRHVAATLSEADVRFGNLEGCLYEPGENDIPDKPWWKHSDESMVDGLVAAGFDAVGNANNVTYDPVAVRNTLAVLDRAGIAHCGAGPSLVAAREPTVVSANGVRFGFLQRTARYYDETARATEDSTGVATINPDKPDYLEEPVASVEALQEKADVVVFSHHLRQASTTDIEPYQRELAAAVVDAGADVVLGHGAHLNQGIEVYDDAAVFHSVGQFAFDGEKIRDRTDGLLVRVHVTDRSVSRVGFVPVSRDEANDVYLAGPGTDDGGRQLDELRELSPEGAFYVVEGEAVLRGIGDRD